uniref:Uncharacterized protein n=1 Tax=Aegilops tauschii subsp. strangulata TaxID=200361 RepID=A0A453P651_AEGTS
QPKYPTHAPPPVSSVFALAAARTPPVSSPSPSLPCATASLSPSGAAPSLGQKIQHELPQAGPPIVAAAPPRPLGLRSSGRLRRATFPPPAAGRSCSSCGKPARCSGGIAEKVPLLVPSSSATTAAATRFSFSLREASAALLFGFVVHVERCSGGAHAKRR